MAMIANNKTDARSPGIGNLLQFGFAEYVATKSTNRHKNDFVTICAAWLSFVDF
jgi:hypothetical protein